MATPAAGTTANASFFFQPTSRRLSQRSSSPHSRPSAPFPTSNAQRMNLQRIPAALPKPLYALRHVSPELAPVRTWDQIVVPQEIRGDAQATKEFLAAKQKEMDGEIAGGLSQLHLKKSIRSMALSPTSSPNSLQNQRVEP